MVATEGEGRQGTGKGNGVIGCWRGFSAPTLLQLKLCNATPRKYTSHTQMVLVGGEGGDDDEDVAGGGVRGQSLCVHYSVQFLAALL